MFDPKDFAYNNDLIGNCGIAALYLGIKDAVEGKKMRNAVEVRTAVVPGDAKSRILYTRKLRQIYGAGYDMIKGAEFIRAKETNA